MGWDWILVFVARSSVPRSSGLYQSVQLFDLSIAGGRTGRQEELGLPILGELLLMDKILNHQGWWLSHYLQGFNHPRWCRISSINRNIRSHGMLYFTILFPQPINQWEGYLTAESQKTWRCFCWKRWPVFDGAKQRFELSVSLCHCFQKTSVIRFVVVIMFSFYHILLGRIACCMKLMPCPPMLHPQNGAHCCIQTSQKGDQGYVKALFDKMLN